MRIRKLLNDMRKSIPSVRPVAYHRPMARAPMGKDRIVELLRAAPLIDGHNDLLWALRNAREKGDDARRRGAEPRVPHGPAAPRGRWRAGSVLVGLCPVGPPRPDQAVIRDHRADRRVPAAPPNPSRPSRARAHRRRRRADRGARQGRLHDRRRGRALDRRLARDPAGVGRARRRLPHAHAQRRHGLGRLGDRAALARWADDVRRGSRPRAEPSRGVRRPVPRVRRHDAPGDRGLAWRR